jgi:hypothetical protein
MRLLNFGAAGVAAVALTATVSATQPGVQVDGNNITMQGCVAPASAPLRAPFENLDLEPRRNPHCRDGSRR